MIAQKLIFLFIFISIVQQSTQKPVKHPIILVPGDGGSQAYCKLNSSSQPFPIWINLEYFILAEIFTNYFRAKYDPETGKMTDNGVCEVSFPGWGSTETIENLDVNPHSQTAYFQTLVTYLVKDPFYVRNKTLRGTPYDFRRSPNENKEFFLRMKDLIEETYDNSGNLTVVIVGHSLGSIYSLEFLKRQTESWKNKYIKAFISASGPHGGSVKALKYEVSGYKMMQKTRASIDNFVGPTGIRELYCIHGSGIETTSQMIYYPPQFYRQAFPNHTPTLKTADGDGTVDLRSLEVCKQWPGAKHIVLSGAEHVTLLGDSRFIDIVYKVLTGAN